MAAPFEFGVTLSNGTKIIHGDGGIVKAAFPPETNIPGELAILSPGHGTDPQTPTFCGPHGLLKLDTNIRMPRHVHLSQKKSSTGASRYVVEKIVVMDGFAVAELGGEIYVVPPETMVLIGPGVPHTWTACPPGMDFQALGLSGEKQPLSKGKFTAVFEYEEPTGFFPTRQMELLKTEEDYVKCDDLQGIRIPAYSIEQLKKDAFFVWGKSVKKLATV